METMQKELAGSQQLLLERLKNHGPQSVRLLSRHLGMTPMGVRQHLAVLADADLVSQGGETRQKRGRPVRLWRLTERGHARFPDHHAQMTVELIDNVREVFGETGLNRLIARWAENGCARYRRELAAVGDSLEHQLQSLVAQRSGEGYMAELRLLPDGAWLLVENHCPIRTAASSCDGICNGELALLKGLFAGSAEVERIDHLLSGARRCTYRISPLQGDTAPAV